MAPLRNSRGGRRLARTMLSITRTPLDASSRLAAVHLCSANDDDEDYYYYHSATSVPCCNIFSPCFASPPPPPPPLNPPSPAPLCSRPRARGLGLGNWDLCALAQHLLGSSSVSSRRPGLIRYASSSGALSADCDVWKKMSVLLQAAAIIDGLRRRVSLVRVAAALDKQASNQPSERASDAVGWPASRPDLLLVYFVGPDSNECAAMSAARPRWPVLPARRPHRPAPRPIECARTEI